MAYTYSHMMIIRLPRSHSSSSSTREALMKARMTLKKSAAKSENVAISPPSHREAFRPVFVDWSLILSSSCSRLIHFILLLIHFLFQPILTPLILIIRHRRIISNIIVVVNIIWKFTFPTYCLFVHSSTSSSDCLIVIDSPFIKLNSSTMQKLAIKAWTISMVIIRENFIRYSLSFIITNLNWISNSTNFNLKPSLSSFLSWYY